MNILQQQVIDLLNASIHNTVPKLDYSKDVMWDKIMEEAKAHSIRGLLYPAIKSITNKDISKEMIESWKKIAFFEAVNQSKHIKNTADILALFNENNIPVIVLKGLIIREYYPKPDLRTMCDSDIIIHKADIDKVRQLLIDRNFSEEEDAGHHIAFKRGNFNLEVHWTLANESFRKGQECFQEKIWEDAIEVKVGGVKTLSLALEDLALHLCAHMASHMAITGFGIRQLADLALLVENEGHNINWNNFMIKSEKSRLLQFSKGMFMLCNYVFNMKIPRELKIKNYKKEEAYLDILINDIFSGGVYGQRDLSYQFRAQVAYDIDSDDKLSIIKRYIEIILPPPSRLSDKYKYARKIKLLLPIAWIHHGIVGITNSNFNKESKRRFLTSTISKAQERNIIVRWLEL